MSNLLTGSKYMLTEVANGLPFMRKPVIFQLQTRLFRASLVNLNLYDEFLIIVNVCCRVGHSIGEVVESIE